VLRTEQEYHLDWLFDSLQGQRIRWRVGPRNPISAHQAVTFWGPQDHLNVEIPDWFFKRTRKMGGDAASFWLRRWLQHRLGTPPERWSYLCDASLLARPMVFRQVGAGTDHYRLGIEEPRAFECFVYCTGISEEQAVCLLRLVHCGHDRQAAELYQSLAGDEHPILFFTDRLGVRIYPELKMVVCWNETTTPAIRIIYSFLQRQVPLIGIGLGEDGEATRVW